LFVLVIAFIFIDHRPFYSAITETFGVDGEAAVEAVWTWLVASLAVASLAAIAVHFIFTRLRMILIDARSSSALTQENAARLRTIAWALLAVNILDVIHGQLSVWASKISGEYFGWSLSLTGWFAVVLLFILAAVFREGDSMRQDLEGTI
jgi:hypothetical protein